MCRWHEPSDADLGVVQPWVQPIAHRQYPWLPQQGDQDCVPVSGVTSFELDGTAGKIVWIKVAWSRLGSGALCCIYWGYSNTDVSKYLFNVRGKTYDPPFCCANACWPCCC